MINEYFISRELNLELRSIGFEGECMAFYNVDLEVLPMINPPYLTASVDGAPTFSQAFRWFDENTSLRGFIVPSIKENCFDWEIKNDDDEDYLMQSDGYFLSREEAELDCIKHLIKLIKDIE